MNITIRVNAAASGLIVLGEVYAVPPNPNDEDKLVGPAHASNGNDYEMPLPSGKYIFKYSVTGGSGKGTVSILDDHGNTLNSKPFDTNNGYTGKTVPFQVP